MEQKADVSPFQLRFDSKICKAGDMLYIIWLQNLRVDMIHTTYGGHGLENGKWDSISSELTLQRSCEQLGKG